MLLLALACCVGLYLGLHFNVWILLPVTLISVMGHPALAWVLDAGYSLTGTAILVLGCQASYFLGLIARANYEEFLTRLKTRSA